MTRAKAKRTRTTLRAVGRELAEHGFSKDVWERGTRAVADLHDGPLTPELKAFADTLVIAYQFDADLARIAGGEQRGPTASP
jgi:hypothetical protein